MAKHRSILIAEDEPDTANFCSFICSGAGIRRLSRPMVLMR